MVTFPRNMPSFVPSADLRITSSGRVELTGTSGILGLLATGRCPLLEVVNENALLCQNQPPGPYLAGLLTMLESSRPLEITFFRRPYLHQLVRPPLWGPLADLLDLVTWGRSGIALSVFLFY